MAARACDSSNFTIITRHILPNAMGPIIIQASMSVASMMLTAAGLSFIGMGVSRPHRNGGYAQHCKGLYEDRRLICFIPRFFYRSERSGLNLVGDGLRDALGSENETVISAQADRQVLTW